MSRSGPGNPNDGHQGGNASYQLTRLIGVPGDSLVAVRLPPHGYRMFCPESIRFGARRYSWNRTVSQQ